MKERPILFSGPMVRALLSGTKTQTRRIVKPQPIDHSALFTMIAQPAYGGTGAVFSGPGGIDARPQKHQRPGTFTCPYGQPGDRLWVRETWANLTETHGQPWERFNPVTRLYGRGRTPFIWCKADGDQPDIGNGELNPERWRPSIFMPRWASRLTLEITSVRVERLQDISKADAIAEGITYSDAFEGFHTEECRHYHGMDPRISYEKLWASINGLGSWAANPWVWVVEFRRVES